jgi:sigma-B regulation protein RsbU (phosphoserine phosphatase)
VVKAINASLIDTIQPGRFCTMLYAELVSGDDGLKVEVISAGHPPPVLMRSGSAQELPVRGPLLGVVPDADFVPVKTTMAPGELMVLVTDGALEARSEERDRNGARQFFGPERLLKLVEQHASEPALIAARSIAHSVIGFGGGRLTDDLAILVLRAKVQ